MMPLSHRANPRSWFSNRQGDFLKSFLKVTVMSRLFPGAISSANTTRYLTCHKLQTGGGGCRTKIKHGQAETVKANSVE